LHVLCFAVADGKKLWERQFWATGSTTCNEKTCMAAATPCTDGERVYALFATGDLACLDADGNLAWYRSLVGDYPTVTNQVGMAASPVLCKDAVVLPMQNAGESFLAALDRRTGRNRWKVSLPRDINWTTPLVVGNGGREEVVFQIPQEVAAYDAETGQKRWSYAAKLTNVPSPIMANGLIMVPTGELLALRPRAGQEPEVAWKAKLSTQGFPTPLYYQDRLYLVKGKVGLVCADPADGKEVWLQRALGLFAASPVAADGKVYLVSE